MDGTWWALVDSLAAPALLAWASVRIVQRYEKGVGSGWAGWSALANRACGC